MNRIKSSFACSWLTQCVLYLVVVVGLASTSFAAQFDAPFMKAQQENKANWSKEDKALDKKLAALEQKFGKKPNIIFILTDDIGWGEVGWQYGGKRRGTPTPELDQIAAEGMAFSSHYRACA
ncbi:hypothetical protein D1AOALGA4SA_8732 [Olavius algarvensis Delta 1 endosymbiont]|nr:hypothetical protein D1AOALGA4SA_8732 [Olavius algarvensis Delta 1 endosymbiont]